MYAIRSYYELAKKRHNSFGKTEMWYVMQAEEQSRLVVGFKKASNQEEYVQHLENNTLLDLLEEIPVKAGDVFFLETGTIHAIGSGVLIAEIQQTSDVTYRLYDWGRVDRITSYNVCYTKLLRTPRMQLSFAVYPCANKPRITSYNVCYTKLLRLLAKRLITSSLFSLM